ncbi:MAG: hypothetical protein V7K32_00290 [Nostoc sp.]|uniref:hypothetical protein n=1 Tax=Nostoc sp. TaxID=1180 RepID=UPI002FF863A2
MRKNGYSNITDTIADGSQLPIPKKANILGFPSKVFFCAIAYVLRRRSRFIQGVFG